MKGVDMHLVVPTTASIGPAEKFTGEVYLNALLTGVSPSRLVAAMVRFNSAARTHWHSHPLGQTLYCTEGRGLVVSRGGKVIIMQAGDTVYTPPGEVHWHGATQDSLMCHLALVEHDDGQTATWFEPVSDRDYQAAHAPTTPTNEQR